MTEIEKIIVKDALPRNWTKKYIPIAQQEKNEFENTKASNNVDLAPHKVFLRYFLMMNFTFLCFSRNLAYFWTYVATTSWNVLQANSDVFNCAASDLLTQNRF